MDMDKNANTNTNTNTNVKCKIFMLQIVKLCVWEAEFVSHLCSANAAENLTDDDDDDDDDDDLYIIGAVCDVFAYFAFLPFLDTFGSKNKRKSV